MHYCESVLETDALMTLEFDPHVTTYTTQPFSINYAIEGRKRRYTPDILAKYGDNSFKSIEVKPLAKFQQPKNIKKFTVLRAFFQRELDHPLILLSCADIYQGAQIDNLKRLYPYCQQRTLNKAQQHAYHQLPEQLTLVSLITTLKNDTYSAYHAAMQLVANRYLSWDVTTPLLDTTMLTKVY